MKFKSKRVALAVAQALGLGSAVAMIGTPVYAAERIEVTGSIIKRVEQEGALPIITLDRKYIEETGFTTATELIQSLPSMQNFVPVSSSVNGGGAGVATAALHALPSKYTLVLVNGQRTAPLGLNTTSHGGGTGVNISSIPLGAVERVEILTDGASAVYGSDAIAGVVNFILKKTETEGVVWGQYNRPEKSGGAGWTAGISKGFGDLDKDKWNLTLTFEHDSRDEIRASQRSVSKDGAFRTFTQNGINYIYNGATSNTEPANIQSFNAYPTGGNPASAVPYTFNPYYRANGNCGGLARDVLLDPTGTGTLGAVGESCRFNYAAFVQDIPSYDKNSLAVNGTWKINNDLTAYATYLWSNNNAYAQFAPPAQPFGINPTTRIPSLYNTYVVPFLAANNLTIVQPSNPSAPWATVGYRGVGLGGRADNYETSWNHLAAGADGRAAGWDYGLRYVHAKTKLTDTLAGGYADSGCLNAQIAAGNYDPIMGTGAGSVAPCILKTLQSKTTSDLDNIHFGAQHDLWNMAGGTSIFALGADYSWNKYATAYGPYALVNSGYSTQNDPATGLPYTATAVGGTGGQVPIDASRNNWSIYGEVLFPVLKNLEFTGSLRYDYYDKVHSKYVFGTEADADGVIQQLANADVGNSYNKMTYKLSARWTPIEQLLVRGSYGTGFKVPTFGDVAGPLVFAGSTSNSYTCPFPGTSGCIAGSAQYDLLAGPNGLSGDAGLKPETSKQWTVGARWDPTKQISVGADFWNVKIKNQILSQGIAEQVAFADPVTYAALFVNPYVDPVGGFNTIALQQIPFNGGEARYRGIDYDANYRTDTSWGMFSTSLSGTHILKAEYTFGPGQPFLSSKGQYGPDQQVVFKNTLQWILNLQTGAWNNNVQMHYRSGYEDQSYLGGNPANIFFQNPDGSIGDLAVDFDRLHVGSYTTWDYQLTYSVARGDKYNVWALPIKLFFGVQNVFDKKPPLSLQSGGGGNQVGYDGRYADPTGRTYYVRAEVRF